MNDAQQKLWSTPFYETMLKMHQKVEDWRFYVAQHPSLKDNRDDLVIGLGRGAESYTIAWEAMMETHSACDNIYGAALEQLEDPHFPPLTIRRTFQDSCALSIRKALLDPECGPYFLIQTLLPMWKEGASSKARINAGELPFTIFGIRGRGRCDIMTRCMDIVDATRINADSAPDLGAN